MTPADRRMTELIDKWLTSIDLHLSYVELSDAAYARVQQWPRHDRPTRWVLEVARQKIVELKAQCETRQALGDHQFAEALELMAFLANLVGIQHIQRFIPLAEGARDEKSAAATSIESPTVIRPAPRLAPVSNDESTREIPKLKATPASAPAAVARRESPKTAPTSAVAKRPAAQSVKSEAVDSTATPDLKIKIIADAVRLLKWGKPWHELAELIGRIAERPPVAEIRKVLRTHKTEIETKAGKKA
jgi:hypothetical protein